MVVIGDSMYISDDSEHYVFAVGADGYLRRKIGRQGQGPGEFYNWVKGLQYSNSHVFVHEYGRVQVFTETFEHVTSFPSLDYLSSRFSVSPEYAFLQCPGAASMESESAWIVCARNASPPYDWAPEIKLLPSLDLPNQGGENGNVVTVTPRGDRIALAYKELPYIFVYDGQLRHLRTIRFEGKQVRDFQPSGFPGEAGVELPAGTQALTKSFILTIKFIDSRHLVARIPKGNYIFDLSDDDYQRKEKIIFRPMNDPEEREDIFAEGFLLRGSTCMYLQYGKSTYTGTRLTWNNL